VDTIRTSFPEGQQKQMKINILGLLLLLWTPAAWTAAGTGWMVTGFEVCLNATGTDWLKSFTLNRKKKLSLVELDGFVLQGLICTVDI